jgi:hypothetical protein
MGEGFDFLGLGEAGQLRVVDEVGEEEGLLGEEWRGLGACCRLRSNG